MRIQPSKQNKKQETRNKKPRNKKQETRNKKQETININHQNQETPFLLAPP
jgi:hypothetical protein